LFLVTFCTFAVLSVIGCRLTSLSVNGLSDACWALGLFFSLFAPVPIYWHRRSNVARRDAVLTIPISLLIAFFVSIPFKVGARLHLPLRDAIFTHIDLAVGIHVGAITSWAAHHRLGHILNRTYSLLGLYMAVALIVPALFGKRESKRLLWANVIALTIGVVAFSLSPAIRPWYGEHFMPTVIQQGIQEQMFALRSANTFSFSILNDNFGIVSFPSFHTVWAIFAASALWGFRYLRVPLVLLSTSIVLSTLTTGWHYLVDVLAGIVLAALSLVAAQALLNRSDMGLEADGRQTSCQALKSHKQLKAEEIQVAD
jgi:membrane-associated phospholipid phosphatase